MQRNTKVSWIEVKLQPFHVLSINANVKQFKIPRLLVLEYDVVSPHFLAPFFQIQLNTLKTIQCAVI
jgi:hypothetical protein